MPQISSFYYFLMLLTITISFYFQWLRLDIDSNCIEVYHLLLYPKIYHFEAIMHTNLSYRAVAGELIPIDD